MIKVNILPSGQMCLSGQTRKKLEKKCPELGSGWDWQCAVHSLSGYIAHKLHVHRKPDGAGDKYKYICRVLVGILYTWYT